MTDRPSPSFRGPSTGMFDCARKPKRTIVTRPSAKLDLKDPSLLRDACYIGGEWLAARNGETISVSNPSSGNAVGTVPNMGASETRQAINQADLALPTWRARTAGQRSQLLRRWFDLIIANQEDLARI